MRIEPALLQLLDRAERAHRARPVMVDRRAVERPSPGAAGVASLARDIGRTTLATVVDLSAEARAAASQAPDGFEAAFTPRTTTGPVAAVPAIDVAG